MSTATRASKPGLRQRIRDRWIDLRYKEGEEHWNHKYHPSLTAPSAWNLPKYKHDDFRTFLNLATTSELRQELRYQKAMHKFLAPMNDVNLHLWEEAIALLQNTIAERTEGNATLATKLRSAFGDGGAKVKAPLEVGQVVEVFRGNACFPGIVGSVKPLLVHCSPMCHPLRVAPKNVKPLSRELNPGETRLIERLRQEAGIGGGGARTRKPTKNSSRRVL